MDDRDIANVLNLYLTSQGYQVKVTPRGRDALSFSRLELPSLILLDILLPDLDGYDLYIEIRERYRQTPVVLMTAYFYDKDHVIKRSRLEGLQEVIFKKPVDPDKLKIIILQRCRPEIAASSPPDVENR